MDALSVTIKIYGGFKMKDLNGLKKDNMTAYLDYVLKRVKEDGGATLSINDYIMIDYVSGFQVGGVIDKYGAKREIIIHNIEELNGAKLWYYLENIKGSAKDYQNIGLWLNDNKLYIELSEHYNNLMTAFRRAIENKQKALFDWEKYEDVKTSWIGDTYDDLKHYFENDLLLNIGDDIAISITDDNGEEAYIDCDELEETMSGLYDVFLTAPIKSISVNDTYYSINEDEENGTTYKAIIHIEV
jgi:hypothetical protein